MVLGALEAGGTKMVCAIGDEFGNVIDRISLPTKEPENTIPEILEYFASHKVEAVGIGCFGPIDPVKGSATYGRILATPKLAWQNYDIVGVFEKALGCPIGFDTDVNASCLGEVSYGESKGLEHCLYMTVGTGVGVGMWLNGKLYHGIAHAEAGHMKLERHPEDTFEGSCPIHGACLEGLAAGPAVEKRWGAKGAALADRKEVWELEAYYIAQACMNLTLTVAPQRIILGGGVMKQEQMLPMIREQFLKQLAGYLTLPQVLDAENFIRLYSLGDNQGVMGCLKLAADAVAESRA
jgi:fructokinase